MQRRSHQSICLQRLKAYLKSKRLISDEPLILPLKREYYEKTIKTHLKWVFLLEYYMKKLYLDCTNGVSGDMLAAALYELLENKEEYLKRLKAALPKGIAVCFENSERYGVKGSTLSVSENRERKHEHITLNGITEIINSMELSSSTKRDVLCVYALIAKAESRAHKVSADEVHFHEVGSERAITCVTAACLAFNMLGADGVCCSKVNTGFGKVSCAHGVLDVPEPAVRELLREIPHFSGEICGELTTPTGAALIKYYAESFEEKTAADNCSEGYGIGKRDFGISTALKAAIIK